MWGRFTKVPSTCPSTLPRCADVSSEEVYTHPSPSPSVSVSPSPSPSPSPPPSPRLRPNPHSTILMMSRERSNKKKIMRVTMFWNQKTKMMPQNMKASKTTFKWKFKIKVVWPWRLMLWRFILSVLRSPGQASQIFSSTWRNVNSVVINWYQESIGMITLIKHIQDLYLSAINAMWERLYREDSL